MLPAFPAPGANIYRSSFSLAANLRTTSLLLRDFGALLDSLQDHSTRLIEDNMAILELLLNASFYHAFLFQTRVFLKSHLSYNWEPLPHQTSLPQEKVILGGILGGYQLYVKWIQQECEFFTRSSGDFIVQRHTFAILKAMQLQAKLAFLTFNKNNQDNQDIDNIILELRKLKDFYDNPYSTLEAPLIITEKQLHTKFQKFINISRSLTEVQTAMELNAKETKDLCRQGANFLSVYHSQNSVTSLSQEALGTAVKRYKESKTVRVYREELASIEFYRHLPLFAHGSLVSVAHKLNSRLSYCRHSTFRLLQMGEYRYGHRYAQVAKSKYSDMFLDFQKIFMLQDTLNKQSIGAYSTTKLLILGLLLAGKYDMARKEIIKLLEKMNTVDITLTNWLYICNDCIMHISASDALKRHITMLSSGDSHLPLLRIFGMAYYSMPIYTSTTVNPLELYEDLKSPERHWDRVKNQESDNLKTLLLGITSKVLMEVVVQSMRWIFHRLALSLADSTGSPFSLVQHIFLLFNLLLIPLDILLVTTTEGHRTELRKVLCVAAPHLDAVVDLILEGKYGILFIVKGSGYSALMTVIRLVAEATMEQYYNDLYTILLKRLSTESVPPTTLYLIEKYTLISI
ncbi:Hypothetical protein GLP15_4521 [Giardia lamblia P15]|uniref:Uncharacterized protein n=1 Tax=Giardia intestinalis (strain P15) TaxID=658858 RepID=E1EZ09_GIAIA|nr:Hypothetical protein GLP15_4521 [Giardia lamblia P15]